jgi:hypothetical protein
VDLAEEVGPRSGHRRPVDGTGGPRGARLPVAARAVEQLPLARDHCGDQYWSAVCRFRTADAMLRAKGDRSVAALMAAEALAVARSLGAAPLVADLELLTRRGRLAAGSSPGDAFRWLGLTEREAEVLGLLAEGRTHMKRRVKALQLARVVPDGSWVFVTGWVRVWGRANLGSWR